MADRLVLYGPEDSANSEAWSFDVDELGPAVVSLEWLVLSTKNDSDRI